MAYSSSSLLLQLHTDYGSAWSIRRMRGKESTLLRFHFEHAFWRYFAIVFPLLILAAGIETTLIVM